MAAALEEASRKEDTNTILLTHDRMIQHYRFFTDELAKHLNVKKQDTNADDIMEFPPN